MVNIDKIKSLAREKGIKIKFLCSQLGLSETYLSNVKNGKDRMTDERLQIIADLLDTTVAYLLDETEIKEKAPTEIIDERDVLIETIISKYRQMTPDQKKQFIYKLNLILDPSLAPKRLEAMIRLLKPDQPNDQ